MAFCLVISAAFVIDYPGNAAVVKPSEVCVHTAKVMEDLLPLYIDKVRMGLMTSTYVSVKQDTVVIHEM